MYLFHLIFFFQIKKEILKPGAPDRIYINCDGVKAADQEALKGVIKYFPSHQGVPMSDFPHRKLYVYEHAKEFVIVRM